MKSLWLVFTGTISVMMSTAALAGDVRGRVDLEIPGIELSAVGPIVVYLDAAERADELRGAEIATIAQHNARFSPSFLIVSRGQTVEMPNVDAIYHNVFSFSRPNDFDLGLYPAGESRSVVFEYAGVVKTYCSIHESMNATIFVAPGPYHALVDADGRFVIEDVPEGRYKLSTWCEKLPATVRDLNVDSGPTGEIKIQLGTPSS